MNAALIRTCVIWISKNVFTAQGKLVDATQEFIALGMSNLLGSFFHSMPVAASFGRTAVNSASSAKTTLVSSVKIRVITCLSDPWTVMCLQDAILWLHFKKSFCWEKVVAIRYEWSHTYFGNCHGFMHCCLCTDVTNSIIPSTRTTRQS